MTAEVSMFDIPYDELGRGVDQECPSDGFEQDKGDHDCPVVSAPLHILPCGNPGNEVQTSIIVETREQVQTTYFDSLKQDMVENSYIHSMKQLQQNKVAIEHLTMKLVTLERETSSIASELDAIESKISPMLSQHSSSYRKGCSFENDEHDGDDTTATCTSTLSKGHNSPEHPVASSLQEVTETASSSVQRYIHLSDLEECSPDENNSVCGPFSSDITAISKCQSVVEKTLRQADGIVARNEAREDAVARKPSNHVLVPEGGDSFLVSTAVRDDLSEVSGLTEVDNSGRAGSFDHDDDASSLASYEKTGRKSHLYAFPVDVCLLKEPVQDLTIPATAEDDDEPPCFVLGVKRRNEEDECACVIS